MWVLPLIFMTLNRKKLYRLYKEERLTVRKRGGRKRALGTQFATTLTTLEIPRYEIGKQAAELMLRRLDGDQSGKAEHEREDVVEVPEVRRDLAPDGQHHKACEQQLLAVGDRSAKSQTAREEERDRPHRCHQDDRRVAAVRRAGEPQRFGDEERKWPDLEIRCHRVQVKTAIREEQPCALRKEVPRRAELQRVLPHEVR